MVALVVQLWIYGVDKEVKLGFLRLGLFWHFLDIVWVAIFSVVYLWGWHEPQRPGAPTRPISLILRWGPSASPALFVLSFGLVRPPRRRPSTAGPGQ